MLLFLTKLFVNRAAAWARFLLSQRAEAADFRTMEGQRARLAPEHKPQNTLRVLPTVLCDRESLSHY